MAGAKSAPADSEHDTTQNRAPNLLDKWCWVGAIMRDSTLTKAALQVAYVLADADGPNGCYPSFATISERANVPVRTAKDAVRRLQDAGYLTHRRGGRNTPNRYRLHYRAADSVQAPASFSGSASVQHTASYASDRVQSPASYPGDERMQATASYPQKGAGSDNLGCSQLQNRVQPPAPYQDQGYRPETPSHHATSRHAAARENACGGGANGDRVGRSGLSADVEQEFVRRIRPEIGDRERSIDLLTSLVRQQGPDKARNKLIGRDAHSGLLGKQATPNFILERVCEDAGKSPDAVRAAPQTATVGGRKYGQITPEEGLARRRQQQAETAPTLTTQDEDEIPF